MEKNMFVGFTDRMRACTGNTCHLTRIKMVTNLSATRSNMVQNDVDKLNSLKYEAQVLLKKLFAASKEYRPTEFRPTNLPAHTTLQYPLLSKHVLPHSYDKIMTRSIQIT